MVDWLERMNSQYMHGFSNIQLDFIFINFIEFHAHYSVNFETDLKINHTVELTVQLE